MRTVGSHVCRRSASLRSFVIAGLDPAIHADEKLDRFADKLSEPRVSMDHRVKPGGDDVFLCRQTSGA
jgi:hypothetical protein